MIIPIFSYSQNKIGILGGINKTYFVSDFLSFESIFHRSYPKKIGIHIGIKYDLKLNENISFSPRIILNQQGYLQQYYSSESVKPTYINFPLNFKFFKKTYCLLGPQVGYILNKKKVEKIYPLKDKFDYGVNIGIGQKIKNLFIELNFYQGFSNPIEIEFHENYSVNEVFQLSLGYNFK
jgi:hypothetical protein